MFDPISRPETMERITTPELAEKFIAEQAQAYIDSLIRRGKL